MPDIFWYMKTFADAAEYSMRMTAPFREFCDQLQHSCRQMEKIAKSRKPLDAKMKEVKALYDRGTLTETEYKRARMLLVEAYANDKA